MTHQTSASAGSLPGLFERIQGLLSQKSSLMISTCSITTCAFRRSLRSFSCWDFDGCFSDMGVLSSSWPEAGFDFGSSNWYYMGSGNWALYREYGWILPGDKPHSPSCTSHPHYCNWFRISRRESHSCPTIPFPDLSADKVSKTEDHITHLELQLCICVVYPALLHHGPKGRIIKVINVAYHLHKPHFLEKKEKRNSQSTCLQLI